MVYAPDWSQLGVIFPVFRTITPMSSDGAGTVSEPVFENHPKK